MGIERKTTVAENKESASTFQEKLAQMKNDLIGDGSLSANDWSMAGNIDKLSKSNPSQEGYAKWKTGLHRWMKTFGEKLNNRIDIANKNGTFEEHEDVLNELKVRFEEIIAIYRSLPQPGGAPKNGGQGGSEVKKEVESPFPADLKPSSGLVDYDIRPVAISNIEPSRKVAETKTCMYFAVTIPGEGEGILRVNYTDSSDEIAFLKLSSEQMTQDLRDYIIDAEESGGFQDIDIDNTGYINDDDFNTSDLGRFPKLLQKLRNLGLRNV